MSTLKTHNLQSPDAGSVNVALAPNSGMVVAGLSTYSNQINVGNNIKLGTAGVVTATSFVGSGANLTSLPIGGSNALSLNDNVNLNIGTGNDGSLFNSGSYIFLKNHNGSVAIQASSGGVISLQKYNNSDIGLQYVVDGKIQLNYDNVSMFETESRGAFVKKGNGSDTTFTVGSTDASGVRICLDGDSNGDAYGNDYAFLQHDSSGDFIISADNPAGNSNLIFKSGNSSERLRITSNGRVHIRPSNTFYAMNSQSTDLVIGDGGGGRGITFWTAGAADNQTISFQCNENLSRAEGEISYGPTATSVTNDRNAMMFRTNSAERLRIASDGVSKFQNFGGGQIHLGGGSAHTAKVTITDNAGSGNGNFIFAGPSSEHLKISSGGSIGIGADSGGNINTRAVLEIGCPFDDVSDNDGSADMGTNNHDAILLNIAGPAAASGKNIGCIAWDKGGRRRAAIMGEYQNTDNDYLALAFFTRGTDGSGDFYKSFIINHNGSAGLHGSLSQNTSDDRLKKDKVEIENALDKVNSLSSFTHKWNEIAVRAGLEENKTEIGLSAQEVQGLYPSLVNVNNTMIDPDNPTTEYLTIHYEKVVPLLVASIKELTAKNKALEARLDALEGS